MVPQFVSDMLAEMSHHWQGCGKWEGGEWFLDRCADLDEDLGVPKEPCIRWGADRPRGRGN